MKFLPSLTIFASLFLCTASVNALRPPKTFPSEEASDCYRDKYLQQGYRSFECGHWHEASISLQRVVMSLPNDPAAIPAEFYLGVSLFNAQDYDFANHAFSSYLTKSNHPEFFEEAIHYKFRIAEAFRKGSRRRLVKLRICPQWASAEDLALSIYDEVIVAMPNHLLAAKSLYAKGCLLQSSQDFKESIENFQTLIRRFPKNELTPEAYLKIAHVYYLQSEYEVQNPDLLALAELNARRFREDFPKEERVECAEQYVLDIKEVYARGLMDIGVFYERTDHPLSAMIYYRSAIGQFPETKAANYCRGRVNYLERMHKIDVIEGEEPATSILPSDDE